MPRKLLIALISSVLLAHPASAQVLARVGSDSISVARFVQEYQAHLPSTTQPDSTRTRLDFLQWMVEESIYLQYGRDVGLENDPGVERAGMVAWRNALIQGLAQSRFMEAAAVPPEVVDAEYRYRNTALLTRYLTLRDSLTAVDYLGKLAAGEPFESLALQTADSAALLDQPGEPSWRFPHQLDPAYARHAYRLTPGQFSMPLRSAGGYQIIQLLGKEFRPDHGHFERVKYHQRIAEELRPIHLVHAARDSVAQWSRGLPYRWRKRSIRKILRSGVLGSPTADSIPEKLAGEVLFNLFKQPYAIEWLLSQQDRLLPEEWAAANRFERLQNLVHQLFVWDRALDMTASLPEGRVLLSEADSLKQAAIHQAVKDSTIARILRSVSTPEDTLRPFLAGQRERYLLPELVQVREIVVSDSTLATALRDSLLSEQAQFKVLAQRHTERKWARTTGGRLGWVPPGIYASAATAIVEAAGSNPTRLVGPLEVGSHYVLVQVDGYLKAQMPPWERLQPRLRQDWITDNRERLIRDGLQRLAEVYPTIIDTSLLLGLRLDGEAPFLTPAAPDTSRPAPTNPDQ